MCDFQHEQLSGVFFRFVGLSGAYDKAWASPPASCLVTQVLLCSLGTCSASGALVPCSFKVCFELGHSFPLDSCPTVLPTGAVTSRG